MRSCRRRPPRLRDARSEKPESVGLHATAVEAYLKRGGRAKAAIDCCVMLNQWSREAVELAEEHGFPQIEGRARQARGALISSAASAPGARVELFRKANKATDAAPALAAIAEDVGITQVNPRLAKQLHVLAALEVESSARPCSSSTMTNRGTDVAQATAATRAARPRPQGARQRAGAAAYHYLLAHRQLPRAAESAMKAAVRLAEFEPEVLARASRAARARASAPRISPRRRRVLARVRGAETTRREAVCRREPRRRRARRAAR